MESELFTEVDELEKSQFLGNFFHWMRNVFTQVKRKDVTPLIERDRNAVEQEPIVSSDLMIKDNVQNEHKQGHKSKKSPTKQAMAQNKQKAKTHTADDDESEKLKRARELLGDDLSSQKSRPKSHPKSIANRQLEKAQ